LLCKYSNIYVTVQIFRQQNNIDVINVDERTINIDERKTKNTLTMEGVGAHTWAI